MQLWDKLAEYAKNFSSYRTTMDFGDVAEILIIAVLLYYTLVWMKTTRAWILLKGLIVILAFLLLAYFFRMTTILWMAQNVLGFAVTALIVVLQPELRKALEELGKKNIISSVLPFDNSHRVNEEFSEKTINEITKACVEMGKVRTGALIVIEQKVSLRDYERTGIDVDGIVTSQLLINIFEHNTPLHDGAVIIQGNRVVSATCYLPLSDNLGLSKELGTRHRAGVGISEITDSLTIIVSEETGKISVAYEGELERNLDADSLRDRMHKILNNPVEEHKNLRIWKGRSRDKKMKKLLTRNLGLKLASLLLAFVLWFLVAQIYDPKDTVTFNNIQVRLINTELLDEEGKVYEVLDNSNLVRVTVTGPQSIVKSELRRSDIVAEADMSKLTDINTIAITYYCENISNDSVEIKGNHDSVRLNVEDKTSKWIKLESNTIGDVASGYMIGNVTLDQTNIEVTGPKSAISQVDHAGVDINVTDSTTSLSANVDIKLYDADDNELVLESVKKNVDSAYMTVEVLATKEVPVEIEYMGVPEDGYMATGEVESSVPTVRIAGTVSTLVGISAITVPEDRMNITGQSDNLVDIINLKEYLPANVRLADKSFDGKITATVYIEPIVSKDLTVAAENISVTGVPDGMEAEITSTAEEYNITVSGLSRDVSILHDSSVTGILNLTQWMEDNGVEELTPGTYTIPVTFNLTEDITVTPDINIHIRLKNADADNQ